MTTSEVLKCVAVTLFIFAMIALIFKGKHQGRSESDLFKGTMLGMIARRKAIYWNNTFKVLILTSAWTLFFSR